MVKGEREKRREGGREGGEEGGVQEGETKTVHERGFQIRCNISQFPPSSVTHLLPPISY